MDKSSGNECIDELIKKNNPKVRRVIESIVASQVAKIAVRSPWQEQMDAMVEADERKYCTTVLLPLYL